MSSCTKAQRLYSTKTRIKTLSPEVKDLSVHLRDYIPLKQGLRLDEIFEFDNYVTGSETIFH